MKTIIIDGHPIGPEHKPFIIAEVSANHGGSLQSALDTIREAKRSGADAVKIQSYTPDTMTLKSDREDFHIKGGTWDGYTLYDLYEEAHTPFEWHEALFDYAREIGITLFSTPFDESAVELLESLGAPVYKIASFEITDLPLLKRVAMTGKPVIMSTGMASMNEIHEAELVLRTNGCQELILLHCVSSYPAPVDDANLRALKTLRDEFPNHLIGLSDHTQAPEVAVAAVALGACVVEKHFILDRNMGGPDSGFSIEPSELKHLCTATETSWRSLGNAEKVLRDSEKGNLRFRRSIYVSEPIKKGEVLTLQNVRRVRPGYGLAPKYYDEVLGQTAIRDLEQGEALQWDMIHERK